MDNDHDLLVRIDTNVKNMMGEISRLRDEDDVLHGRITDNGEKTDEKFDKTNERIGRVKIWSMASAGLGGLIGAVGAYFSTTHGGK